MGVSFSQELMLKTKIKRSSFQRNGNLVVGREFKHFLPYWAVNCRLTSMRKQGDGASLIFSGEMHTVQGFRLPNDCHFVYATVRFDLKNFPYFCIDNENVLAHFVLYLLRIRALIIVFKWDAVARFPNDEFYSQTR